MAKKNRVVTAYLDAYKKLVASEPVMDKTADGQSIVLSLPLHFSGNHRVEVTVTEFNPGKFILSDMARTLGELAEGGRSITSDFRKRAEEIAKCFGGRFVMDHLLMDCEENQLGVTIQRFAEACKTIGDAHLLQRSRAVHAREVVNEVKRIFEARRLKFKEDVKVPGELEDHPFDIVVPSNGRPGVAVAVISGHNTHALAKIWAFNMSDVRKANPQMTLGIVLDEEDSAPWTKGSKKILRANADIVATSKDLNVIDHGLIMAGLV